MERGDVNARYDLDPRAESGTYKSLIDPDLGTFSTVTLAYLGRRKPSKNQLEEARVAATAQSALWQVWASELVDAAVTPKVGDHIVDAAGVTWAVRMVESLLFGVRYHCTCVKVG